MICVRIDVIGAMLSGEIVLGRITQGNFVLGDMTDKEQYRMFVWIDDNKELNVSHPD